ncbi:hypothetical protein LCGC14_1056900, partial [marine sediment metagenome]
PQQAAAPPLQFGPGPSPSGRFVDRVEPEDGGGGFLGLGDVLGTAVGLPQGVPGLTADVFEHLMETPVTIPMGVGPFAPRSTATTPEIGEALLEAEPVPREQVKKHIIEPIVPEFDLGRVTLPKPPGILQEAVLDIAGVPEEEQPAIKQAVEEAKPLGIQVSSATVEEAASWVADPINVVFFAGPALRGAGGAARLANQIRKTGSIPNFVRAAMRVSTEETATGVARPWIMGLRAERDATRSTIEALRTSGKKELIPELESWLARVEADLTRAEGRGIVAPAADIGAGAGLAPTAEEISGLASIKAAAAADISAAKARPLEAPLEADVFAERGVADIGARPGAQIPAEEGLISSQVLEPPPPGTLPGAPSILSTRLPNVRTPLDKVLRVAGEEAGGGRPFGEAGLRAEREIRQEVGVVEKLGDENWIFADGAIVDVSSTSRELPTARVSDVRGLLGERYGGFFHTDVSIRFLPQEERAAFYRELDELAESPSDLLQFDWDARNRFGKFTEAVSIQKQTDGTLDIVVYGPLSPQQKVGVEQAVRDAKTITQPSSKRYLLEDEARELGYAIERVAVESERISPLQTGPLKNEYWSIADPSQVKTIPKWQGHQIVVDTTPDGITRLNVTLPSEKFNARIASPEDIGPAGRVTTTNVRAKLDEFDQVVGPGTFPGPEPEGVILKRPTKIGPIEEAVPTGLSTKEAKELDKLQGIKGKLSNKQTARLSGLEAKSLPPEPPAPNPFEIGGFSRAPTQMRGPRRVEGGPAEGAAEQVENIESFVADRLPQFATTEADLRALESGQGTFRMYHGTPSDFADEILAGGFRQPSSGEEAIRRIAQWYDIPEDEFIRYGILPLYGEETSRISTSSAAVAARWAETGAFPRGEIFSNLNSNARLHVEIVNRLRDKGVKLTKGSYDAMYNRLFKEAEELGVGRTVNHKVADILKLPDQFPSRTSGGTLLELTIDASRVDNPHNIALTLREQASAPGTYFDVKIPPDAIKGMRPVATTSGQARIPVDPLGGFPNQFAGRSRALRGGPAPDDLGGFSRGGGGGRIGGGGVVEGGPPFEGSSGEEAIAKLTDLINQAKKPRRGQTLLQHEELQHRFRIVAERLKTGEGTPEEIAARAKAALGGPQPKAQFEPVRPFMTESEVQSLYARANTFDFGLHRVAENVRTVDALTKVLTGTLPQQAEMELLEKVFGAQLIKALQAKGPLGPKIYRNVVDLLSLPKTALTILDHSFPGRQGIKLAPSHPVAWKDSFWQGLRAMRSKQVTQDLVVARATDSTPILVREGETVKTIPFGQLKEIIGVYEAPFGEAAKLSAREEAFISRWARLIPGVQLSERAFLTSGNEIRHSVVRGLLIEANKGNIPIELKQAQALANLVNRASGRGTLGPLNELAPVLNGLMFAPRYRVSSPEWAATILNFGNPKAQKEAVKEIISFVGTGVGVLALLEISGLAKVNIDPTSADFGKGKIGKTRIDFWAHMQQMARAVAMLYEGERQTSTGERVSIGREEVAYNYFRSGLSPFAGLLEDVRTGRNIAGEEFEGTPSGIRTQAFNRLVPLVWQDIVDGVREEGVRGGLISSLAIGGIGIQTYETFAQQRAIEFQKETGMEFDYNNSGHWAILRTNKNLVEKFGELGDQAQETQNFLTEEMEGLALPEMAQRMSSGSADPQVYLEFREGWEDFEGIRANAAARLAFGRDRDPAEDKTFQAYIEIDRNDPKYKDPVTFEIDYGAYRRDKDAAFKRLDPAIQEAFLQIGAPDPEVAQWATTYTVARNLRRDLYAMSKWEGLTPEQSRQLDQFSLEVRKRAPQIAAQLGRRVTEADVARFLAEQQGQPGLAEWFIGLQSSTERDRRRSVEYGLFLAENVAGLRLFYPELYSQASLERIGLIEGEPSLGPQPVAPVAPVAPAPVGGR